MVVKQITTNESQKMEIKCTHKLTRVSHIKKYQKQYKNITY